MAKELKEFIDGDDKYIAQVAKEIDLVYEDYVAGNIDEGMMQELVEDSIELAKVRMEAKDLKLKVNLEKMFEVAKMLAKLI